MLNDWDPIGVRDEPAAQDEYDSYALVVQGMLSRNARLSELEDYLVLVQVEYMGIPRHAREWAVRALAKLILLATDETPGAH